MLCSAIHRSCLGAPNATNNTSGRAAHRRSRISGESSLRGEPEYVPATAAPGCFCCRAAAAFSATPGAGPQQIERIASLCRKSAQLVDHADAGRSPTKGPSQELTRQYDAYAIGSTQGCSVQGALENGVAPGLHYKLGVDGTDLVESRRCLAEEARQKHTGIFLIAVIYVNPQYVAPLQACSLFIWHLAKV